MKKLTLLLVLFTYYNSQAQKTKELPTDALTKELANNSCMCIDSIQLYNKAIDQVTKEINSCINQQVSALQLGKKLLAIEDIAAKAKDKNGKKQVDIDINFNKDSDEYKQAYYELERYLMSDCTAIKEKAAANEKQNAKSVSENKKALEYYSLGLKASTKENFEQAADYFKKAVQEDPEFAFAWDNLGISYRHLNDYDKAIEAYNKSIAIDPNGLMPLQNIAVAYVHKEEFTNAIKAYEKLAIVDRNNPE
ncbi:tetratricopeptide repeat protein, partial [Flavobacterium sp.]|uniref:tetratricopeptide repeat protein n=1 Tax=Flavobacterium sp. TaxID=239 RepID=UPI002629ABD0